MNIDGNIFYGCLLVPLFIYEQVTYSLFDPLDIGIAFFTVGSITMGMIGISQALKYGKAGPAFAIENSKTIW
jgi:hypothetical protein